MGYYTSHTLSTDSVDNYEIIEHLRSENDEAAYNIEADGQPNENGKWYYHEEHLREFSKKYPDVLFTLNGEGEESGDIWVEYYKNGLMQKSIAIITFDPFNESKLK